MVKFKEWLKKYALSISIIASVIIVLFIVSIVYLTYLKNNDKKDSLTLSSETSSDTLANASTYYVKPIVAESSESSKAVSSETSSKKISSKVTSEIKITGDVKKPVSSTTLIKEKPLTSKPSYVPPPPKTEDTSSWVQDENANGLTHGSETIWEDGETWYYHIGLKGFISPVDWKLYGDYKDLKIDNIDKYTKEGTKKWSELAGGRWEWYCRHCNRWLEDWAWYCGSEREQ